MTGSDETRQAEAASMTDAASTLRPAKAIPRSEKLVTETTTGGVVLGHRDRPPPRARDVRTTPEAIKAQSYPAFRLLVDELCRTAAALAAKTGEDFDDDWAGVAVQVDHLLDRLYETNWGDQDALRKVVSVVIGIVRNADWAPAHVQYLTAVAQELRTCYHIDHALGVKVSAMAEEFGLDPYRGTVSKSRGRKQYKLVEISE